MSKKIKESVEELKAENLRLLDIVYEVEKDAFFERSILDNRIESIRTNVIALLKQGKLTMNDGRYIMGLEPINSCQEMLNLEEAIFKLQEARQKLGFPAYVVDENFTFSYLMKKTE